MESGPHLKNRKNVEFLSKTSPAPLKNYKATKPALNVGPSSSNSETPFEWCFADRQIKARL